MLRPIRLPRGSHSASPLDRSSGLGPSPGLPACAVAELRLGRCPLQLSRQHRILTGFPSHPGEHGSGCTWPGRAHCGRVTDNANHGSHFLARVKQGLPFCRVNACSGQIGWHGQRRPPEAQPMAVRPRDRGFPPWPSATPGNTAADHATEGTCTCPVTLCGSHPDGLLLHAAKVATVPCRSENNHPSPHPAIYHRLPAPCWAPPHLRADVNRLL